MNLCSLQNILYPVSALSDFITSTSDYLVPSLECNITLSIHPHSSGLYEGFHRNCPLSVVGPIKSGNQRGSVVVRRHVSVREALKVLVEHLKVPIK